MQVSGSYWSTYLFKECHHQHYKPPSGRLRPPRAVGLVWRGLLLLFWVEVEVDDKCIVMV